MTQSEWKEILKIRVEIIKIEAKNTREKINETKIWFFEKVNKTDKPLAILNKKKKKRGSSNK